MISNVKKFWSDHTFMLSLLSGSILTGITLTSFCDWMNTTLTLTENTEFNNYIDTVLVIRYTFISYTLIRSVSAPVQHFRSVCYIQGPLTNEDSLQDSGWNSIFVLYLCSYDEPKALLDPPVQRGHILAFSDTHATLLFFSSFCEPAFTSILPRPPT